MQLQTLKCVVLVHYCAQHNCSRYHLMAQLSTPGVYCTVPVVCQKISAYYCTRTLATYVSTLLCIHLLRLTCILGTSSKAAINASSSTAPAPPVNTCVRHTCVTSAALCQLCSESGVSFIETVGLASSVMAHQSQ